MNPPDQTTATGDPPGVLPLLENGVPRSPSKAPASSWSPAGRRRQGAMLGLALVLAAGAAVTMQRGAGREAAVEQQRVAMATGDVVALGRLQPAGGVVSVSPPQGAGDARIDRMLVEEGDVVAAGDVLAELDSLPLYESALVAAERSLAVRHAMLAQAQVHVEAASSELRAQIRGAEAALAVAQRERSRIGRLREQDVMSQSALDDAGRAAEAASADLERLRASLARYSPGPEGEAVDIVVAKADLAAAEAAVEQARRDLDRGRVIAPRGGVIIDVDARAGERPSASGLLQMGDTARMEAELEVFEAMARRVAVGQAVSLGSPALGDEPLVGTVSRVGTLVGRQSVTADDPAANTDARVLRVTVALDAASSARASRFVHLEVIGRIDAGEGPVAGDSGP